MSVIDKAELPGAPVSPSLSRNLFLAFALGVAAATAAVWLIELLDDTFKSVEDIEERLRLPVLGVIPFYRDPDGKRSAISEVTDDLSSPLAESYRSLRTAIQFSTAEGAPRALLVTSARAGEGKSTTAISLAINFSQLGLRVLLIDADLRNPSVHRAYEFGEYCRSVQLPLGHAVERGVTPRKSRVGACQGDVDFECLCVDLRSTPA